VLAALAGTETGVELTPFHRFEPVIPRSNFEPGLELLCVARRDRVQDLAGAILYFRIECGAYGAFDYGVRMRDDRTVVLCPTIDRRNYEAIPTAGSMPLSHSDAADRMCRHRQRRREGLRCLTIELRETEIDALIGKLLLLECDRDDPSAITRALYGFLDRKLRAA
jgi:hypothetical protein